jgi:hypothetical protein
MSSAVSETAVWETSVIGPDGTDLISAAGVRNGLQDLANRTKWLKETFFDIQTAAGVPSTATSSSSYADIDSSFNLTFTDVEIGDRIILIGAFNILGTTGTVVSTLRWYDGTNALGLAESEFLTAAGNGAKCVSLIGATTIAADAGSYVCKPQWKVATATTTEMELSVTANSLVWGVRLRMGA